MRRISQIKEKKKQTQDVFHFFDLIFSQLMKSVNRITHIDCEYARFAYSAVRNSYTIWFFDISFFLLSEARVFLAQVPRSKK